MANCIIPEILEHFKEATLDPLEIGWFVWIIVSMFILGKVFNAGFIFFPLVRSQNP